MQLPVLSQRVLASADFQRKMWNDSAGIITLSHMAEAVSWNTEDTLTVYSFQILGFDEEGGLGGDAEDYCVSESVSTQLKGLTEN